MDRAVFAKLNRMRISPSELCTDQEFIRRVYLDTIGILPTPEEVQAFLSSAPSDRRGQVDRRTAGAARVLRLLGAQVRRHPPLQRPTDPAQGSLRVPPVDPRRPRAEHADGPVRPRAADDRRLDLLEPRRQLLPDQPRPGEPPSRRPPSSSWASGSSAPSATTTPSSAGPRTIITALPPSSRRSAARRGTCRRRRSSTRPMPATSASPAPAR